MTDANSTPPSRPFNFRLALGLPALAAALLLVLQPVALDFYLERLFYTPDSGFWGKHNYFLETILHHRAKQLVIAVGVLILVSFLVSLLTPWLRSWRRQLGYLVLSLTLCTGIVTPLKILTDVHCPWSLEDFGGSEKYSTLLEPRAPSDKAGLCWPGGHASTGFSLICLFFALRDRRPHLARWALATALLLGAVFSLGRMIQGAHFLSHNLWTLLIDWTIAATCYRLLLFRNSATALAAAADSEASPAL